MTTATQLHMAYNGTQQVAGGSDIDGLKATVATNVATLVSDGASPTQAHVTTLNTNWGSLKAALAYDVVILVDTNTNKLMTINGLRAIFNDALLQAASAGMSAA